jgi:hypothetical protein
VTLPDQTLLSIPGPFFQHPTRAYQTSPAPARLCHARQDPIKPDPIKYGGSAIGRFRNCKVPLRFRTLKFEGFAIEGFAIGWFRNWRVTQLAALQIHHKHSQRVSCLCKPLWDARLKFDHAAPFITMCNIPIAKLSNCGNSLGCWDVVYLWDLVLGMPHRRRSARGSLLVIYVMVPLSAHITLAAFSKKHGHARLPP